MKLYTGSLLLLLLLSHFTEAQYYYKDLVVPRQSTARWKVYKENKVRSVTLNSFEGDGSASEGFLCNQDVKSDYSLITTHTRSAGTPESWLLAYYNAAGQPIKTLDTSDTYRSQTEYQYDASGRLTLLSNTSLETDNKLQEQELHIWHYDALGSPTEMWKIRNSTDTTYIRLVKDDHGLIVEEHATRNRTELPVVYYYYDTEHRLTDIVRYNDKAGRLLPDFVFTWGQGEQPASMLVVKEGGAGYQKWLYEYNNQGLKTQESCYNRKKQLVGRVEYQYK